MGGGGGVVAQAETASDVTTKSAIRLMMRLLFGQFRYHNESRAYAFLGPGVGRAVGALSLH